MRTSRETRKNRAKKILAILDYTWAYTTDLARDLKCTRAEIRTVTSILLEKELIIYKNPSKQIHRTDKSYDEDSLAKWFGIKQFDVPIKVSCADCGEVKTRILKTGPYRIYEDNNGNKWSGRVCPECIKERGQEVRTMPTKTTERKCRKCEKKLPATRYFNCIDCQPQLKSLNEDFIYEASSDTMVSDDLYFSDSEIELLSSSSREMEENEED